MKFYIIRDVTVQNNDADSAEEKLEPVIEELIVSEKVEPGEEPNPYHQELHLPETFFISVPNRILTRRQDTSSNAVFQATLEAEDYQSVYATGFRTAAGKMIWGDRQQYETHLDSMGLTAFAETRRRKEIIQEEISIDADTAAEMKPDAIAEDKSENTASRSTRRIKRSREVETEYHFSLPAGTNFKTLENAYQKLPDAKNQWLIGFASLVQSPDMLYITKDINMVNHVITKTHAPDASPLHRYRQWKWFHTGDIAYAIQHIIDLLTKQSLLPQLQFITHEGHVLAAATFGQPLTTLLASTFTELGLDEDPNGGGKAMFDLVRGYADDRKVAACDFLVTPQIPDLTNLNAYKLSTDKAYLRVGMCYLLCVNYSPEGRILSSLNSADISDPVILQSIIPDVPDGVDQLYILSPDGLYYWNNIDRSGPFTQANVVNTSSRRDLNENLTNDQSFSAVDLQMLSKFNKEYLVTSVGHHRATEDQYYYIDRTYHKCELLNMSKERIERLDRNLEINMSDVNESRVIFYSELTKFADIANHSYEQATSVYAIEAAEPAKVAAAVEAIAEHEREMKVQEERALAFSQSKTPQVIIEKTIKSLYTAMCLNNFVQYKAALDKLNKNSVMLEGVIVGLARQLSDASSPFFAAKAEIKKRHHVFLQKYQNGNVEELPNKKPKNSHRN